MPSQADIQKEITGRIIDGLLFGVVPWRKPWKNDANSGAPANALTRKPYSGINPILLDLTAMSRGYASRFWATFEQWKTLGCSVRKRPAALPPGRWGTNIVFYRQVEKTKTDVNGDTKKERFPVLRYFTVFNASQVDGIVADKLQPGQQAETLPVEPDFEEAHTTIAACNADIRYGGDQAFYVRPIGPTFPHHTDGDYIWMPLKSQFDSTNEFYATLMHEHVHWSEIRRGWTGSYAMGELIAEIGACYLCAAVGIPCTSSMDNHTAYLAEWLKALKDDDKAIFRAASQASKATELILSFSRAQQPEAEELQVS